MNLPIESAASPGMPAVPPAPNGAEHMAVPAADATALSLLALLIFCLVCFVWGAAILGRRERLARRSDEDEGRPPETKAAAEEATKPRAPWEREADWWKK